jgi:hypothetical protein
MTVTRGCVIRSVGFCIRGLIFMGYGVSKPKKMDDYVL